MFRYIIDHVVRFINPFLSLFFSPFLTLLQDWSSQNQCYTDCFSINVLPSCYM